MARKRKNKKTDGKGINHRVLKFLTINHNKSFTAKQLSRKLSLTNTSGRQQLDAALDYLYGVGKIDLEGDFYKISQNELDRVEKKSAHFVTGRIDHVNPRFAFAIIDEHDEDVKLSANHLNGAIDGDEVQIAIRKQAQNGKKAEGEVTEILKRERTEFVGRLEMSGNYAFVIPDNRKIYFDIFIPGERIGKAKDRDKVIAEVIDWGNSTKNPVGKVTKVLGPSGSNEAEMHSILLEYGLPFEFPENVELEAEKIDTAIPGSEIKKRRDMRSVTTFTIDPLEAKDFDDALSFKQLNNGHWEIGIHIADVSYYMKPGSIIDKEAYRRATSVYLVDRVVPMLPEVLSNNLCSLNPHEDKLTFSAIFELDHRGKVFNEWFGRTVIHSDRRFVYEEAQDIMDNGKGDYYEELSTLNSIAKNLKKERFKRGAINFETPEVKFVLDEKGTPLEVIPKVRKDAHKLIEEFMLLANRRVATWVHDKVKGEKRLTMVYRTHDLPDPEKLNNFANFARRFGYNVSFEEGKGISDSINSMVEQMEGKPEENILQSLAVRSMAKAKYTTSPDQHFGLAFAHYTHFTSPIRRYPDVMVHRLLQHYLDGGKSEDEKKYEERCEHSSEREKMAADAERASIKYKQVEYMQNMKEEVFEGIISGVTEFGIFVEMTATKCEGMIKVADLDDDYYEYDEENFRLIGKKNKRMFTFGDPLKVRVINTDLDRRTIDLELVEDENRS